MSDVVERARAALEGVSAGPWRHHYPNQCCADHCAAADDGGGLHNALPTVHANAAFVAEARSLVPELVAEVERLRGEHLESCRHCSLPSWVVHCSNGVTQAMCQHHGFISTERREGL